MLIKNPPENTFCSRTCRAVMAKSIQTKFCISTPRMDVVK